MNQNQAIFNYEDNDSPFIPIGRKRNQNKMSKGKKSAKFNSSIWKFTENQKYVQFLIQQQSTMQNAQERKQSRVFVRMSQFIKGRSPEQCRSHHQKIMKNYQSIQNIISNLMKVKETKLINKVKQKKQNQIPIPIQYTSQQVQILQKPQIPIQLATVITPEPSLDLLQDMWEMIDEKMWIG